MACRCTVLATYLHDADHRRHWTTPDQPPNPEPDQLASIGHFRPKDNASFANFAAESWSVAQFAVFARFELGA
jgi:hypothetical protein